MNFGYFGPTRRAPSATPAGKRVYMIGDIHRSCDLLSITAITRDDVARGHSRVGMAGLTIVAALTACQPSKGSTPHPADPTAECAARGVRYFERIGSYPLLKAEPNVGRSAATVALERCRKTTTAF